jgi:hypothetical protein
MTPLRQRFLDEMTRRNYAPHHGRLPCRKGADRAEVEPGPKGARRGVAGGPESLRGAKPGEMGPANGGAWGNGQPREWVLAGRRWGE